MFQWTKRVYTQTYHKRREFTSCARLTTPSIKQNLLFLLQRALRLILTENSFQFNGRDYLQIHGTAMGTKMAVAFANIFMAKVETEIISQSTLKPLVWKRFIDDIFTLWNTTRERILQFIEQAYKHHPTITKYLKYLIEKQTSWTSSFTKNRCLIYAPTLNLLRSFSTFTSLHATNMELKEGSSKRLFGLLRTNQKGRSCAEGAATKHPTMPCVICYQSRRKRLETYFAEGCDELVFS